MERPFPIIWPAMGLVEGWSFSDQPANSAREYQNVRYQDPTNGRLRGAQRSGLSKYVSSPLKAAGTKAHGLVSFFVDNRQVTYSAIASGSETITWDKVTPSTSDCLNVKTDRQGNVYALDGNSGVVKYSADGALLWQLAVPVKDSNHLIRALWVDVDDKVYIGVSSGGDQDKAALWCYEQIPDNKTEQLWEIVTKAYVEDIRISQDKLYTCQNRPDRKKSYVRVYEFIDTANPEQTQEWRVPHPVNSIAVKKDGSVIVACESTTDDTTLYWRSRDPLYPDSSPDSVDWEPMNLTNSTKRLWAHLRGDSIDQTDVVSDIEDGVEIARWRDESRGLRHHYATFGDGQSTPDEAPVLALDAWLEHKGIRFNVGNGNGPFQALRSLPNASISKAFADQQRTLLPGYTDSMWAMFIVCRPSQSSPDAAATQRWLVAQDRDNASSGSDFHCLFMNTSSANNTTLPPTASSGGIYWYTGESLVSGGDGTGGSILQGTFTSRQDSGTNSDGSTTTNKNQVVLLTLVCDGAVSGAGHGSIFRVNGSPVDKFQSRANVTQKASYIGLYRESISASSPNPSNTVKNFLGDVLEIIVLDRKSRSDASQGVITFEALDFGDAAVTQSINELTLVEGYLAHKYGIQENLPWGTAAGDNFPHPFGITGSGTDKVSAPPNQAGDAANTAQGKANKSFACVVKYDAKGKIVWCANETQLETAARTGGYGYAVAVNSDGNIYSVGPNPTVSGGTQQVRLIIDQGTTFSIDSADGAWSASYPSNANQDYHYPRVDVDEFDNLYVPYNDSAAAASLRVYKKDGTVLHSHLLGSSQQAYAVAVDTRIPDYRSDLSTKRVEHVFVGTENTSDIAVEVLHKVQLVSSAHASGSVRSLYTMGVSGGDVKRFTTAAVSTPTGGTGALSSGAKYVQATTLYKKAYWTDGQTIVVYDPISNAVSNYSSASAGAVPSRCALIESWRGRIVLARSADEPHNWFLSKKDDPTNWDYFPPVPSEVDAVAGNNSSAGLCPDIINSVVPYSEDILVFGGDHSIWMLVGDPAAGGRLELVSDITGMAFGRPWCKDPNGVLYFVGSRGGLFRWGPGAKPERLSLGRIERQLQDIDFSAYHIKLAWNYQDEGINIIQCPFGAGGTQVAHWFYGIRSDEFAKDIYGTTAATNVQPTDLLVIDGDDFSDRLLLFGCEDGYIRKWDSTATSDDTKTDLSTPIAIDSFCTWFPLEAGEQVTGMETQFHGLTVVLGDRDSGCHYDLFSSDEPDSIGISQRSGELGPGRNPPSWEKVVGTYCGMRLRNAAADERWSFERAYLYAVPAGMARPLARD